MIRILILYPLIWNRRLAWPGAESASGRCWTTVVNDAA